MRITVVIPVYNDAYHLEKCLVSLSKQTREADEIIIVDNNCSDDSAGIARSHGVLVVNEANQGIWPAAAKGYDSTKSDIIARCDADSLLPPDWLKHIEAAFSRNQQLDVITGPGKFYDANTFVTALAQFSYMQAYFFLVGLGLGYKPLFGSNFAMRRHAWQKVRQKVHRHRSDLFDDIDLSIHLGPKIFYDKNLAVGISIRPLRSPLKMTQRYIKGCQTILMHWPKHGPWKVGSSKDLN